MRHTYDGCYVWASPYDGKDYKMDDGAWMLFAFVGVLSDLMFEMRLIHGFLVSWPDRATKVVLSTSGFFGVSEEGIAWLVEHGVPVERIGIDERPEGLHVTEHTDGSRYLYDAFDQGRADPRLVAMVEALGDRANAESPSDGKLKIVLIPTYVKNWAITAPDGPGPEYIYEPHRIWTHEGVRWRKR